MLIVGLTGGIASGKSTVSNLFAKLGVPIIDTDIIARQVVEPGQPALEEIAHTFGNQVLTNKGELDRTAMRELIFNDETKRKQLEAILHPRIRQEMLTQANQLNSAYCIFVIPLLIETGQTETVHRILVIDCPDEARQQHLKQRDKISDEQIKKIFAAQATRDQRLKQADDIISNDKDINHLRTQVNALHSRYTLMTGQ